MFSHTHNTIDDMYTIEEQLETLGQVYLGKKGSSNMVSLKTSENRDCGMIYSYWKQREVYTIKVNI